MSPLGHRAWRSVAAGSSAARPCSNITDRRPSARMTVPASGSISPASDAQQRALAAAVGAEQAELRAGRQHQVEAGEQRPAAERLGDARGGEQLARLPAGGDEVDARRAGRGVAVLQLRQFLAAPGGLLDARSRPCACAPLPCGPATPSRGGPGWRPTPAGGPGASRNSSRRSANSS